VLPLVELRWVKVFALHLANDTTDDALAECRIAFQPQRYLAQEFAAPSQDRGSYREGGVCRDRATAPVEDICR
jgi:hypothetical protein